MTSEGDGWRGMGSGEILEIVVFRGQRDMESYVTEVNEVSHDLRGHSEAAVRSSCSVQ